MALNVDLKGRRNWVGKGVATRTMIMRLFTKIYGCPSDNLTLVCDCPSKDFDHVSVLLKIRGWSYIQIFRLVANCLGQVTHLQKTLEVS